MVRDSDARGTVVELTRPCPEVRNELLGGMRRNRGMHRKCKDTRGDLDDGCKTLHRIVGNAFEEADVGCEGVSSHEQRVAVGRCPCNVLRSYDGACAGLVFDDDRLAPAPLKFLSDRAG